MEDPTDISYRDLIDEAFIKPIRSVLIVDDDYPTIHDTLTPEADLEEWQVLKHWRNNPAAVRAVIDQFRKPDAPHILDIHDGRMPTEEAEKEELSELQQTDLLILDYELDRNEGGGKQAVDIARRALNNPHFNLILVHTKTELTKVFEEFLLGLLHPAFMNEAGRDNLPDAVENFLDEHKQRLSESIDFNTYQSARQDMKAATEKLFTGKDEWAAAAKLFEDESIPKGRLRQQIVSEWLATYEAARADLFSELYDGRISWSFRSPYYIQGDRGLIAFTDKSKQEDLLAALTETLVAWSPRPSRLLLTKLRAAMNTRGIEVEDDALYHSSTGAIWYEKMLSSDPAMRSKQVERTVRNHAEQLLDCLLPDVNKFVSVMVDLDGEENDTQAVAGSRYNVDLSKDKVREDGLIRHNVFAGSKRPSRTHLEIGHLLRIGEEKWLCVSPACDMIPNQGENIGQMKRITLMRLASGDKPKDMLATAHTGSHMFFELNEEPSLVALTDKNSNQGAPKWTAVFAANNGMLRSDEGELATVDLHFASQSDDGLLEWKEQKATVVGQLRYEYALHMQSKFISSQSRIGLDFSSVK